LGGGGFWHCGDQNKKAGTVKGIFLKKELQKSPYFEEKQSQKSPYLDYEFLLVAITRQESLKKLLYCLRGLCFFGYTM
jgi:hypothetical protein